LQAQQSWLGTQSYFSAKCHSLSVIKSTGYVLRAFDHFYLTLAQTVSPVFAVNLFNDFFASDVQKHPAMTDGTVLEMRERRFIPVSCRNRVNPLPICNHVRRLNIWLDSKDLKRLAIVAKKMTPGTKVSQLIRQAISEFLERNEK
jgi:hypothetical protein